MESESKERKYSEKVERESRVKNRSKEVGRKNSKNSGERWSEKNERVSEKMERESRVRMWRET